MLHIAVTRTYDNGRKVTVETEGPSSLDETIDAFRGALVSAGYPVEVAQRLQLVEDEPA